MIKMMHVYVSAALWFVRFGKNIKIVHFIGSFKPWHACFNVESGQVETVGDVASHRLELLQKWWSMFMMYVKPQLAATSVSLCSHFYSSSSFTWNNDWL